MARNPDKRKCAQVGCRAWAKRGELLCASHSKRKKVGAPKGNKNAVKHGFYGVPKLAGEVAVVPTLEQEIALLASRRDAVDQWMMTRVEAGDEVDVLKYLALLGEIGSRIARMLKSREGVGGDLVEALFSEVLDLLNRRVEVEV